MSLVLDRLEDGDLGLGFGLKPGSLIRPEDTNVHCFKLPKLFTGDPPNAVSKAICSGETVNERIDTVKKSSLISALLDSSIFPSKRSNSLFRKRDFSCNQEIDLLNYELDSLRRQLLSKQQAIKILQHQLKYCCIQNEELENRIKWVQGALIKDFNFLQFSVERERLVTSESREMLLTKVDHLEAENKCLKIVIDRQREELNSYKNLGCDLNFQNLIASSANEQSSSLKESDQVLTECRCLCSEHGRCLCAKYADKLVGVLRFSTRELQEFRRSRESAHTGGTGLFNENQLPSLADNCQESSALACCSGSELRETFFDAVSSCTTSFESVSGSYSHNNGPDFKNYAEGNDFASESLMEESLNAQLGHNR